MSLVMIFSFVCILRTWLPDVVFNRLNFKLCSFFFLLSSIFICYPVLYCSCILQNTPKITHMCECLCSWHQGYATSVLNIFQVQWVVNASMSELSLSQLKTCESPSQGFYFFNDLEVRNSIGFYQEWRCSVTQNSLLWIDMSHIICCKSSLIFLQTSAVCPGPSLWSRSDHFQGPLFLSHTTHLICRNPWRKSTKRLQRLDRNV